MALTFFGFWIYILIDAIMLLAFLGYFIYHNFFDTRLRVFKFYSNKQFEIYRKKIKDESVDVIDSNTDKPHTYTVNRNYIYYNKGRIPYAFFWNNIPIPINMYDSPEIPEKIQKEVKILINQINDKINKYSTKQINVEMPTKKLKENIEIDTAETFFRVLHTNFTLNLIKPPTEFKKAIKWTIILISIGIAIALILHFTGVIDITQILGAKPPVKVK